MLPNGTGKSVRVAVFARGDKADEAKAAGADVVGAEERVEQVMSGKIDFVRCMAWLLYMSPSLRHRTRYRIPPPSRKYNTYTFFFICRLCAIY